MGCVANISATSWPKQGSWLGKRVLVCFHYKSDVEIPGTIVRDDAESPGLTIISLDTGRVVLATECQYSLEPSDEASDPAR